MCFESLKLIKMITKTPDLTPICLGYSLKNIPSSKKEHYMVKMLTSWLGKCVGKLSTWIWRNKDLLKKEYSEIFPTHKNPNVDKNLERFENDLYNLVKSLKFRKVKIFLFLRMRKDLNEIRKTNNFLLLLTNR